MYTLLAIVSIIVFSIGVYYAIIWYIKYLDKNDIKPISKTHGVGRHSQTPIKLKL